MLRGEISGLLFTTENAKFAEKNFEFEFLQFPVLRPFVVGVVSNILNDWNVWNDWNSPSAVSVAPPRLAQDI